MKSLQEFKQEPEILEEESSDYSKFDVLVRAGLANKTQLARMHKILDKMQEENAQFSRADKEIIRNIFNRMTDLITNNKQIYQKTKQAVREEMELNENPISGDPPFVLVLKRKAYRPYPNGLKVALYYNEKLNKYFSIPYSTEKDVDGVIQAEEIEYIQESVMDQLHKIVAGKQKQRVKFGDGSTRSVDHFTASAITQVHNALNDDNKKKFADMVHKSPAHLAKASDFAFKHAK